MTIQQIMITNGGPHPADKWAEVTADTILGLIVIDDNSVSDEAFQARKIKRELREKLFNLFHEHHHVVQVKERANAKAKIKTIEAAHAHCNIDQTPIDVMPYLVTLDEVDGIFAGTPFAAHFAKEEVREVIKQIIGRDTANVMNIERLHHRDQIAKGAK